jgi:hypothetical protein
MKQAIRSGLIAGFILVCTACATTPVSQWNAAGKSSAQREQDLNECKYEAEKSTASLGDGKLPKDTGDAVNRGVERGMEQAELIKSCMKVRGYSAG